MKSISLSDEINKSIRCLQQIQRPDVPDSVDREFRAVGGGQAVRTGADTSVPPEALDGGSRVDSHGRLDASDV